MRYIRRVPIDCEVGLAPSVTVLLISVWPIASAKAWGELHEDISKAGRTENRFHAIVLDFFPQMKYIHSL